MSSVFQVQRKQSSSSSSLPLSHAQETKSGPGIRRRLSSLSLNLKIQGPSSSSSSKSMGDYYSISCKWWGWGWGWILSRKPTFAADVEMNEEETAALGTHSRGTWRHLFYKLTSHIRRKLLRPDNVPLPRSINKRSTSSFIH